METSVKAIRVADEACFGVVAIRGSGSTFVLRKLADDTYRLFRPTDAAHPARKGKTMPARDELPKKYHYLLDWYEREYCGKQSAMREEDDPILQMRGVGKEIWADTNADEYVRSLRADWDEDERAAGS